MELWESILIALVGGGTAVGLGEVIRLIRERAARRRLSADWDLTLAHHDPLLDVRATIITNTGHADAFNVRVTITGNSKFEMHPDAPLDRCRPRDAILALVIHPGTGVYRIDWTNAKGVAQGPVFRFPPTDEPIRVDATLTP